VLICGLLGRKPERWRWS